MILNNQVIKNEKGQALLFVIVALTVAMAVSVSLSSRTLSSLKRTTSTDTASRVYSASEGGIEWFVRQPTSVLKDLSDDNSDYTCPGGTVDAEEEEPACALNYTSTTGDKITARAVISVDTYTYNSPEDYPDEHRILNIDSGETKEVFLKGTNVSDTYYGGVDICWVSRDPTLVSNTYIVVYNETGVTDKLLIQDHSQTYSSLQGEERELTFKDRVAQAIAAPQPSRSGYTDCFTYTIENLPDDNWGLRIKSLYAPSKVGVFPLSNNKDLPSQGFKIISRGELLENDATKTTKTIVTYRSHQYLPGIFDNALYSQGPLIQY